jgi:hypothetical protein
VDHIGVTVGGAVAAAAIAGAATTWAALKHWVIVEIPSGLVVASLHECRELAGNWVPFEAAGGRFIIGAGFHPPNPGVTKSYAAFGKEGDQPPTGMQRSTGGEERHVLNPAQMPEHDHAVYPHAGFRLSDPSPAERDQPHQGAQAGDTTTFVHPGITGKAGGHEPLELIPPYVSLYYCKKG